MGATTTKSSYDTDFVEWTAQTAALLREGRIDEIDIEHLAEEIEDLGKSDQRAVHSQLRRMLVHMIKQKIQPERDGSSWRSSIVNAQEEILDGIKDSPSLRNQLKKSLESVYTRAVKQAAREMKLPASRAKAIPVQCPYTLTELLDGTPEDSL